MRHDRHMEPKARRDCRMSIDYVIAVTVRENVIQASNFFATTNPKTSLRRVFLFAKPSEPVMVGGGFFSPLR